MPWNGNDNFHRELMEKVNAFDNKNNSKNKPLPLELSKGQITPPPEHTAQTREAKNYNALIEIIRSHNGFMPKTIPSDIPMSTETPYPTFYASLMNTIWERSTEQTGESSISEHISDKKHYSASQDMNLAPNMHSNQEESRQSTPSPEAMPQSQKSESSISDKKHYSALQDTNLAINTHSNQEESRQSTPPLEAMHQSQEMDPAQASDSNEITSLADLVKTYTKV